VSAPGELALERRAQRLEGEVLSRVVYQQLRWSAASPAWAAAGPHPVEVAVFLETAAGARLRVRWADELGLRHGYGVAIDPVRVLDPAAGTLHEASELAAWTERIGRRVLRARVHWQEIERALRGSVRTSLAIGLDHLSRVDFPQTLELELEGGAAVFLVAARLDESTRRAVGFTNHLLVIFAREELEALGLA
jgi:hypothetical protein